MESQFLTALFYNFKDLLDHLSWLRNWSFVGNSEVCDNPSQAIHSHCLIDTDINGFCEAQSPNDSSKGYAICTIKGEFERRRRHQSSQRELTPTWATSSDPKSPGKQCIIETAVTQTLSKPFL
jgi:hypothetical protein